MTTELKAEVLNKYPRIGPARSTHLVGGCERNKRKVHRTSALEHCKGHLNVSNGYYFGGRARGASQDQMWAPWEREQVWSAVGWSEDLGRKGLAVVPLAALELGQESHETTQRDGELQPGSREPQETGAQLETSAEPVPGLALIICQATPRRPAAGPEGFGHPAM